MPAEMLFEKSHNIIIGLIVIVIAAVIIISVLAATGVLTPSPQYDATASPPIVSCLGGVLSVNFDNIMIKSKETFSAMPILTYMNALSYNPANAIQVEKGGGQRSLAYNFSVMPSADEYPWFTLTFWKWSPDGCIDKTVEAEPTYAALVRECAADFIASQTIQSANKC
jgi:hypothetical protein